MALTFVKFNSFVEAVAEKVHNLGSDTLKVALTNSAPSAANTVLANITQISTAGGYSTGGTATTISSSAQVSGTYKLVITDVTFTASGAAYDQWRYIVLYNSTATNGELIGYWDYGSGLTLNDGDSFTADFDATNGVLTIA